MRNNSEKMTKEFLQTKEKLKDTEKHVHTLRRRLEKMSPSRLSTLDDAWVSAFTPFRSKVCLVGFLMTMTWCFPIWNTHGTLRVSRTDMTNYVAKLKLQSKMAADQVTVIALLMWSWRRNDNVFVIERWWFSDSGFLFLLNRYVDIVSSKLRFFSVTSPRLFQIE